MQPMKPTPEGTQDLRRCVRDLVALSTLPAVWVNADPLSIGRSLAEVLLRMLSLDFIYVRLHGGAGGPPREAARTRHRTASATRAHEIGQALGPWLRFDDADAPPSIPSPVGDGTVRLAVFPIGHGHDYGLLAAGCGRSDFPTDTERLLLGVGVNQAAGVLQRKEAEEQLRRSEQELADFFQNATVGLHWVGPDGTILRANRAELDLLGYSPEEYVGHRIAEFHADPDVIADILRRLSAGETLRDYEARLRCKDGSIKHVLIHSSVLWEDGRFVHTRCFTRDITDQKRATEARRQLAALVESSDDAILGKTLDGIITSWNTGARRLYGYPPDEVIGKHISVLVPPARQDELPGIMARLRRGERIEHYETVRRRRDGSLVDVSVTISPIVDAAGAVIGASSIARDITRQKRMEAALLEADRRKDEFLAMLAHELRNPLAPIRNAVQILRAKGPPVPELQWARDVIDRQAQQMTRLVDDLLDVSRITRGKIELRKERVPLAAVVSSAVEASRPLVEKWGHELTVTIPPEPVYLEGDLTRLAQALLNLLNNAAKYTGQGGRIWLTADQDGSQVVIRVKDTGVGIPAEMLPRIFEMFVQVDHSLERSQGGLGIGLTLVHRLVEMHGGSVEAHSDGPGRGSEFVVRLPVAGAVEGRGRREGAGDGEKPPAPAQCRILVVDDNRDAADSLGMLLRMLGNEVHTAHDGLEAVGAAAVFRPDVVLLDIGLPKLNGYEAARRIRQQNGGGDMVLIALTGWGQEEDRRRSKEAGFDHHLTKPVEFDALQKLLAEAGLKSR